MELLNRRFESHFYIKNKYKKEENLCYQKKCRKN